MANERPRVSFSRKAHANLVAHAKESVDAEICGVLVGEARGNEIDVRAIIRGAAAREARAHVTFTHETWNHIHATLDKDYPDFQIVGWYHTHPGFGVEFSAMDRFIHENFFSGATQVAYLSDPLGGEVSLCTNSPDGIEYLPKFWVDGREHAAKVPGGAAASESAASAQSSDVQRDIERLEQRVNQLIHALDEQRSYFHRTLLTMLMVVCVGVAGLVGWRIWNDRLERVEPPKVQSFAPVPVKIGDKTVLLGVALLQWDVPRELNALLDKIARAEADDRKRMQEELLERQQDRKKKK
jgi:proteasome lid subunit RPN8/RPN11